MLFNQRKRFTLAACTLLTGLTLGAGAAHAQFDQFQTAIGGTNWDGGLQNLITTQDGGIITTFAQNLITVGETRSYGSDYDLYVSNVDPCGDLIWSRTIDLGGDDHGRKIRQCPDSGFIIVGSIDYGLVPGQDRDAFLLKLSKNGVVQWVARYGATGFGKRDDGKDVRVDMTTGDIYACGYTRPSSKGNTDGWIWKTSSTGTSIWSKTYGGLREDYFNALELGCHGAVLATGSTTSYSGVSQSEDLMIVKVNATNGNVIWGTRRWGEGTEVGKGIAVNPNGEDFYVVGYTANNSAPGMQEYLGVYFCADGLPDQETVVGAVDPRDSACLTDVQYDPAGGLLVVGNWRVNPATSGTVVHMMRTTSGTTPLLSRQYHGPNDGEYGYSLTPTFDFNGDGQYDIAMVGTTTSFGRGLGDVYVVGTDPFGVSGCNEHDLPYLRYDPFLSYQSINPDVKDYLIDFGIPYNSSSNLDYTRICSSCYPEGIMAPPGGGGLSRREAGGDASPVSLIPMR